MLCYIKPFGWVLDSWTNPMISISFNGFIMNQNQNQKTFIRYIYNEASVIIYIGNVLHMQDWMQRNLLARQSKSLDDITVEKHSRILWCFVASHPQYCQYIFPFPDVIKNLFPLRVVQLVHKAECRHNAEEYKPQIVGRTVVIDTEYEIKLLTHKRQPISRPWGRAMVCLLWECLEKTDRAVMASHWILS